MVSPARFVHTSARCTEDGGLLVVHGLASQAPILFDSLECLLHLVDVELLDDVGLAILLEILHVSLVHIRGRAAML